MDSWVTDAFGEWYPSVYPHRGEEEAARLVGTLSRAVELRGRRILDVGCGAGRHLGPLRGAGASPVGLDLSAFLLAEAREASRRVGGVSSLVRGDMRALPFRDAAFAGVVSLFTSFGYYSADEDRRVLTNCARVLRPEGFLLLDFLNRDFVITHHKARSERLSGAHRIVEERRLTAGQRQAIKRITVLPVAGGPFLADYEERVTLYRGEELRTWLAESGLPVRLEWGDYDGSPFAARTSARHLFLSAKETA